MSEYRVIELNGSIVLESIIDPWCMSTLPEHKEVWRRFYLNQIVIERENFNIKEVDIGEEMVEVIAMPIVKSELYKSKI